jgi:molybdopterin-guanine dinucleotide biosynthesis protein A
MRIAGVVLAGGRSRRFGRDKALEPLDGQPLAHWSLAALRPGAACLAVNGSAALAARLALPLVEDLAGAAAGPLAGIVGALAWAGSAGCSHLMTAPCDTPFLPAGLAAALAGAIGRAPVAAARAERVHALCALWRVDLAGRLAPIARQADQPSLQALIEDLGGAYADFPREADFANLNTQADLAAAQARLGQGGG